MKYDSSIVGEKVINAAGKEGTIHKISPLIHGRGELRSPAGDQRSLLRIKNCSAVNK